MSTPSSSQQPSPQGPRRFGSKALAWWRNPYTRFGLICLALVLVAAGATWLAHWPGWVVVLVVILVVNLTTLSMYRYDKRVAGSERMRVPEALLLALAFLGGSPAAYIAIYRFRERHKAEKKSFVISYWLIVAVQVVALIALLISRFR